MVCTECCQFLHPRYKISTTGSDTYKFYRSISGLRSGSTSCGICQALAQQLPSDDPTSSPAWREIFSIFPDDNAHYTASLIENAKSKGTYRLRLRLDRVGSRRFSSPMLSDLDQKVFTEFLLVPVSRAADICGDESQSHRQVPSTTACAPALDMAKDWLENCLVHHHFCRARPPVLDEPHIIDSSRFLPTRVVHILPEAIRLYTTTGSESDDFQYATLSHRWPLNADSILQLTAENLHPWHSEIEQSDTFSMAFRDAIVVCKHLGIDYLWIDSLCIIQRGDGGQDWQREASRMGDVYKYGLINIAATSVADGEEGLEKGFFRERSSSLIQANVVTASCDYDKQTRRDGLIGDVVNTIQKWDAESTAYYFIPTHQMAGDVLRAPLNQRAWVMQERHMSPRILHFTKHQIFWECNETICSETYPKAEPVELFRRAARSKAFLGQIAADKPDSPVPRPASLQPLPTNPYHLWYELVGIYSRGGLTKTTDKLIALSGIAREMLPHLGGVESDYVAGLWRQDILYGLLWKTPETTGRKNQAVRPGPGEPYQAPSWSWASVNCPVTINYQLHSTPHDALATVEEAQATPKLGPFGEVRPGARLRINGTAYKAQFRYSHFSGRDWPELTIGTKRMSSKFKGSFAILPDDPFADDAQTRQRYRHVRLLSILQSKQKGTFGRQSPGSWAWLVMLMLVPTTEKPGEYRRFGLVELKGNGSDTVLDLGMVGKRVCDPLQGTFTVI